MMNKKQSDIIYSDPVREIMEHPPGKILRWGNVVIFFAFTICIVFISVIKYPDTITSKVEITTVNPPVMLFSKITGPIKNLYVKDKDTVNTGRLIAVMESAASISEINRLKEITDTLRLPESFTMLSLQNITGLGEIEEYWSTFLKASSEYRNYIGSDLFGSKIASLNHQISALVDYIGKVKLKESLYIENEMLEVKKYKRDSLLNFTGVYSESDLEKSRQSLIRLKIELQQVRLDHSAKTIELAEKQQLLQDYRIMKIQETERYHSTLNESFLNLKARIKIWENTYLLISPVNGIVTFTKYWTENQSVMKDEPVIGIVPLDPGEYIGRISLKMNRSGKVKSGQIVNIKLSGYPYLEYGMIRGVIKSKSLVPSGDYYIIELSLPSGLTTLYNKKLDFTQNMQGSAEIMTDNLSLLMKIINPFRYLISKNKQ